MRAYAMGSQGPTATTLSHFWLLGSKYQSEMGPKTKTNTYEFTVFSFVLTLPRNRSEWYELGDRVNLLTSFENGLSVLVYVCY